jgi:hypothetical protein
MLLLFHAGDLLAQNDSNEDESASTQIWANLTLDKIKSERLLLELDFEPKLQIVGEPKWRNIDITALAEYYPNSWIDVTGEITVGRTVQDDLLRTIELTPRFGIRLHILSNLREMFEDATHHSPLRRIAIANLSRIELRNFGYSDDTPSSHEWRFRNRVEFKMGINRANFNLARTLYLIADIEAFVPLGDDTPERFASKLRTRVGLGFRINYKWRVEGLFIRDDQRGSSDEDYVRAVNALDLRVKLLF